MPRRRRRLDSEHYFHVINRSSFRVPIFLRPKDYRDFLSILREGLQRFSVPLVAYCIMDNHWHLVVGPTGTPGLSRLLHWVTTTHAVRIHRRRKTVGEGPVYQGRFKSHVIEEAGQLVRVCRYVERNALAAGLVRRAQDWPWGSLADRLRSLPALPLTGASFLSSETWIRHVNAEHREAPPRPVPDLWKPVEKRPVPLRHVAKAPGGRRTKRRQERVTVLGRARQHQTDAHVERAKHLRVLKMAGRLKPAEQRRNVPAFPIE